MYTFFQWLVSAVSDVVDVLDSYSFDFGGVSASIFELLLGILGVSMVISIFWKGARG